MIRAAIQEDVLHNRSLVKMGTTAAQKKLFFNLRRMKSRLGELSEGDLPPAVVLGIAEELGVTEEEVVEMNRRLAATDHSLATPLSGDGDREWQDTLVSENEDQESAIAEASELKWRRGLLAEGMGVLNERERHILAERRLNEQPPRRSGSEPDLRRLARARASDRGPGLREAAPRHARGRGQPRRWPTRRLSG